MTAGEPKRQQAAELKRVVTDKERQLSQGASSLAQLTQQQDQLRREQDTLKVEVKRIEDQIVQSRQQITQHQQDLERIEHQRRLDVGQAPEQNAARYLFSKATQNEDRLQHERDSLVAEVKSLEDQLVKARQNITEHERLLPEKDREIQGINATLDQLRREAADLNGQIGELERQALEDDDNEIREAAA